eukprot:11240911-Ditylum_brightwellii.AAC.1
MVKQRINTIFGVICVIITVFSVSVVSRKPCSTKDTAGSANTDPQATQNNPLSSATTTSKHNNQLLGAFTGTSRTQSPHRHSYYGNAVLLSDAGATALAPKPGNGTNNAEGL